MILIWGDTTAKVPKRWVGDYCPICRELRACKASELRRVPHFMFLPVGRGEPLLWFARCSECKTRLCRPPTFFHKGARRAAVLDLVEQTHPFTSEEIEALIARDAAIDGGEADDQMKVQAALDSINQLSFEIDRRINHGGQKTMDALFLLATLALGAGALGAIAGGHWLAWILTPLLALAIGSLVYRAAWGTRRAHEKTFARYFSRACPTDGGDPKFVTEVFRQLNIAGTSWSRGLDPGRVANRVASQVDPKLSLGQRHEPAPTSIAA